MKIAVSSLGTAITVSNPPGICLSNGTFTPGGATWVLLENYACKSFGDMPVIRGLKLTLVTVSDGETTFIFASKVTT